MAIHLLGIDVRALLQPGGNICKDDIHAILEESQSKQTLRKACKQLCAEFPELFKPELGYHKDYELEISFKLGGKPVFCKPQTVPFAILEDLNAAHDVGIRNFVWVLTLFNMSMGLLWCLYGRRFY